jgi:hypothetical protein
MLYFCAFASEYQTNRYKNMRILTIDKITEIFCVVDDFCKNFQPEME